MMEIVNVDEYILTMMHLLERTREYGTDTNCLFMDVHSAYSLLTEWNYIWLCRN
jgi:hypothetical protein